MAPKPVINSAKIILLCIMASISSSSFAIDGAMFSYGWGMNDYLIQYKDISGAKQQSIGLFWLTNSKYNHGLLGEGELEVEAYLSRIKKQQTMNLIALRPMFTFWQNNSLQQPWYWQFGVGLSYFDNKVLQPVKLSTRPQFATIFGLGMPLDKQQNHRLTLRYNHYSNGYLVKPNVGLDTFSFDWHLKF